MIFTLHPCVKTLWLPTLNVWWEREKIQLWLLTFAAWCPFGIFQPTRWWHHEIDCLGAVNSTVESSVVAIWKSDHEFPWMLKYSIAFDVVLFQYCRGEDNRFMSGMENQINMLLLLYRTNKCKLPVIRCTFLVSM